MPKRREERDDVILEWHTSDGILRKNFTRSNLLRTSDFFEAYDRMHPGCTLFTVKRSFSPQTIKNLFVHLDGGKLCISEIETILLESVLDFIIARPPFDTFQVHEDRRMCYWCTKEYTDQDEPCPAKRWWRSMNDCRCALCSETVYLCDCVHTNKHCSDKKAVYNFKFPFTYKYD